MIEWGDDDDTDGVLKRGGPADSLHRELRESICGRSRKLCRKSGIEVDTDGDSLFDKHVGAPKCDAPDAGGDKGKKKNKKAATKPAVDPISAM